MQAAETLTCVARALLAIIGIYRREAAILIRPTKFESSQTAMPNLGFYDVLLPMTSICIGTNCTQEILTNKTRSLHLDLSRWMSRRPDVMLSLLFPNRVQITHFGFNGCYAIRTSEALKRPLEFKRNGYQYDTILKLERRSTIWYQPHRELVHRSRLRTCCFRYIRYVFWQQRMHVHFYSERPFFHKHMTVSISWRSWLMSKSQTGPFSRPLHAISCAKSTFFQVTLVQKKYISSALTFVDDRSHNHVVSGEKRVK